MTVDEQSLKNAVYLPHVSWVIGCSGTIETFHLVASFIPPYFLCLLTIFKDYPFYKLIFLIFRHTKIKRVAGPVSHAIPPRVLSSMLLEYKMHIHTMHFFLL
uniref:Ovule protein n=1 Tax=Heterorhabditis bacteriophora TaxID=37862 RepID=A0A1I7WLY6_HETBA